MNKAAEDVENPYASPVESSAPNPSNDFMWTLLPIAFLSVAMVLLAMATDLAGQLGATFETEARSKIAVGFAGLFGVANSIIVICAWLGGARLIPRTKRTQEPPHD